MLVDNEWSIDKNKNYKFFYKNKKILNIIFKISWVIFKSNINVFLNF